MGNRKYFFKQGDVINGLVLMGEKVVEVSKNGRRRAKYPFRCKCGNLFLATIPHVAKGTHSSCKQCRIKAYTNANRTHGLTNHKVYRIWSRIKRRCFNQDHRDYHYYGGRGITLYGPWEKDFQSFFNYVTSLNGYDESKLGRGTGKLTLDREDNDGDYEPHNLRWADQHTHKLLIAETFDPIGRVILE